MAAEIRMAKIKMRLSFIQNLMFLKYTLIDRFSKVKKTLLINAKCLCFRIKNNKIFREKSAKMTLSNMTHRGV